MKKYLTLKIERKIKVEDIRNLLDSASRGSNYWCSSCLDFDSDTMLPFTGKVAKMYDHEGEKNRTLDIKKIERGLKKMALDYPDHFSDFVKGDYDMNTGDIFLQLCLLGKVIYA